MLLRTDMGILCNFLLLLYTHQNLRESVTKMSTWLMMLTCRYSADIISSRLPCSDLTPNVFCRSAGAMQTKVGSYLTGREENLMAQKSAAGRSNANKASG